MTVETQRNFVTGDHWLYYKVYTGYKTADRILTEVILPLSQFLKEQGLIEKWFFIRYNDPENHLRVRFYTKDKKNVGPIINEVYNNLDSFINNGLIWDLQTNTYKREIERYGHYNIVNAENYFHFESELIVNFLRLIEGEEGEEIRWLFGLKSIDSFLNLFDLEVERKLYLLNNLKTAFGLEFGMTRELKKQLNVKYGKEKKKIEYFLNSDLSNTEYSPIHTLLLQNKNQTSEIIKKTLELKDAKLLEMPLEDLIYSHIHMLMNRLFRSKNRMHEMVIYDFLYRFYNSICARKRINT